MQEACNTKNRQIVSSRRHMFSLKTNLPERRRYIEKSAWKCWKPSYVPNTVITRQKSRRYLEGKILLLALFAARTKQQEE